VCGLVVDRGAGYIIVPLVKRAVPEWRTTRMAVNSIHSVELPGIEPGSLPGLLAFEQAFRSVSVLFSTVRYLRFRSRVLTASRGLAAVRAAGLSLYPEEFVEVFHVDK
jgi:hypothetical protein